MVLRGGRDVITVEIIKTTYDRMKLAAQENGWTTKAYINAILLDSFERERFTKIHFPSLSILGIVDEIYFLKDKELGKVTVARKEILVLVFFVPLRFVQTCTICPRIKYLGEVQES